MTKNVNLQVLFHRSVGRGNLTSFWLESWAGPVALKEKYPQLYALDSIKHCLVMDRFQISGGEGIFSWEWSRPPGSASELAEFVACCGEVSTFGFSPSSDKWIWGGYPTGTFSVRSLRSLWVSNTFSSLDYVHNWNNLVPLKLNFFGWRAVLNRLPSKTELIKRGVALSSSVCGTCGVAEESVDHLLRDCSWAKEVWSSIQLWCDIDLSNVGSIDCLLNTGHEFLKSPIQLKVTNAVILTTLWAIWKARNARVFNNIETPPAKVLEDIKTSSFLWIKNRGKGIMVNWVILHIHTLVLRIISPMVKLGFRKILMLCGDYMEDLEVCFDS
ncbi:hypothetical protein LXL04_007617 [Taraxacum kok-saghyz]